MKIGVYATPLWLMGLKPADETSLWRAVRSMTRSMCAITGHAVTPDQRLDITGLYADKNKPWITFILLVMDAGGQKIRLDGRTIME
jgi:hypothetical protein